MTAHVETNQQLHQFAAIVECSDDAIISKALDGAILTWNRAAERLYGYAADEVIGHSATILQPPEKAGEIVSMLERVCRGEHVTHFETVRLAKGGRRVDVSLTISPVEDAHGRIRGAVTIAREFAVPKRSEQLPRESEVYNRGLIEASLDGLVTVSGDLVITDVNESWCRLVGRPRSDVIGSLFPEYFTHPARAAEGVQSALDQDAVTDYDLTLRRADGEEALVSFNAAPCVAPSTGTVHGVFAAARDVTERRRAERALRESEARFRSVVQALGEGIIVQKVDGEVIECNEAAQRIMGLTRAQLLSGTWGGHPPMLFRDDGSLLQMPDETHPALRTLRTGLPTRDVVLGMDTCDGIRWMIMNAEPMRLPGEDQPFAVVTSLTDITDYRRTQEELRTSQERALHDELTGLPNRALLLDHLQTALTRAHRYGSVVALLFLDLDDFKAVNDSLGHHVGDEYLIQVGKRLAGTLRGSDTAARLGGDEFVVLCEDLSDPAEAGVLADRIQQTLAVEICLKGERVSASASIGVAIGRPGSTPETLLRDADAAMYAAKRDGGRRWCFCGGGLPRVD